MKNVILVIALFFGGFVANAQMKIAHVNSQKLLDTLPSRKIAMGDLKKFETDGMKELGEIQKDLEAAYARYEANKATWSPVILKIEEEKIMKKQQALEDRQGQLQQEMQIYGQELNQPILERIQKAVELVADRKKVNYVIDESQTLYFKGGIDMTAEVMVELLRMDAEALKK